METHLVWMGLLVSFVFRFHTSWSAQIVFYTLMHPVVSFATINNTFSSLLRTFLHPYSKTASQEIPSVSRLTKEYPITVLLNEIVTLFNELA